MNDNQLLIVAMSDRCKSLIQEVKAGSSDLPPSLHPEHLFWMCQLIERHAEEWRDTKLHRWIGFIQGGMIANGMLDFETAKSMFNEAKEAYGVGEADEDLLDHLDPTRSFELEIGGEA